MSNTILFVFEGEKTEACVFDSLKKNFPIGNHVLCPTFNSDIYQLYEAMSSSDGMIDLLELLRERNDKNKALLDNITRKNVVEIYLFFDYDGHATKAADEKIKKLLDYFDNETELGKLYISYPMVEAIKHLKIDQNEHCFCYINIPIKEVKYKELVGNSSDIDNMGRWDKGCWNFVINAHCKKVNYLLTGECKFPQQQFEQSDIFSKQLEKHIEPYGTVAVLSAFPILLLDYYGATKLQERIRQPVFV